MEYLDRFKHGMKSFWSLGFLLLMVAAMACGSAAQTEDAAPAAQEPAPAAQEPAAVQPAPDTSGSTSMAVATPTPAAAPEAMMDKSMESVEKFTIMVTSQGNEQFAPKYSSGENNLWHRLSQTWLIGANYKDGSLLIDPETGIANDWKITNGGHTWEFTIREGIKFHDGSDVTVEDVYFSNLMNVSEEGTSVSAVRVARQLTNREITGPATFSITTETPLGIIAAAWGEIDNSTQGIIINQDYWMSLPKGETVENCTPVDVCDRFSEFQKNPSPGLVGAYEVVAHLPTEEFLYERFEDYFLADQRPYPFDQISLRLVPELSTRVAALQAGAADLIEADLTVIDQIEASEGQVMYVEEAVHIWINANGCDRATDNDGLPVMCNDPNVRYALDYAIDKTVVQQLYGGENVFTIAGYQGIASPSGLGYEDDIAPLAFDPDKAQELMASAGYPNGEGFNGGRVFPIHTWTGAGAPLTVEVSQLICNMWKTTLGINCEVKVGEEVSLKKIQYAGEIAGQYLVRTNENTFDGGRRMLGRYSSDGYIAQDAELAENIILPALGTVGTLEERHEAYHTALKTVFDKHYDFSPGYLNQPYGVGIRVASWDPWPLSPYPSALWTMKFK
jgi:peptide/nickel transport system substrate-binding protein